MDSIDGRSNLSSEGENRSSRGKSKTELQREKRKSEVLIAAQSIENEVQSVKSLKRISIGSIDLLIDPEMEFTINNPSTRRSWSSSSSSSGEEADVGGIASHDKKSSGLTEDNDNTFATDGYENSFETTSADYLQSGNPVQEGFESVDLSNSSQRPGMSQSSSKRTLSGVGSLRRGGVNTTTGAEWSRTPADDDNTSSGSSITNQLFWVPADQHPNVKPENYLELVQDTLHNIQLEDKDEKLDQTENGTGSLAALKILPIDLTHKRDSLVRRPSRLRKSYTEFEEYDEDEEETELRWNNHKAVEQAKGPTKSIRGSRRAVSLKDITEELNKISNNAGLTSSDAITLARTLSMAGTYSSTDVNPKGDFSTQNGQRKPFAYDATGKHEEESEFASNMLTRHGVVIPARSSLRRSKFNTYRIRSSGSAISLNDEETDAGHHAVIQTKGELKGEDRRTVLAERSQNQSHLVGSQKPSTEESRNIGSSPSTINDFQDIYNHYHQPSVDWEKEMSKEKSEQPPSAISSDREKPQSEDRELSKTNVTTENHVDSAPMLSQTSGEKKSGWSWLNGITNKDSSNARQAKGDVKELPIPLDGSHLSSDYEKVSDHTRTYSEKVANYRTNHSKNRHLPIISASEPATHEHSSSEKDVASASKQTNLSVTDSTNLKRQKFEKKFVNLFKRKVRGKSNGHKSSKIPINGETRSTSSLEILPKSSKPLKKPIKLKSESNAEEQLRNAQTAVVRATSRDNSEDNWSKHEAEKDDLPALQPAVSVTSTKSNHTPVGEPCVVESVKELDEDDSQDMSGDQSANSGIDLMQEALIMKEQANDDTAMPSTSNHVMPPRKLTFDDVERPTRPNAAMNFTDSAFGFPLPMLTISTVIMFDHRLPINVERAIYRLSHLKLSDPKRELRQQVILSNFMYAYLNLVNHTLYMEQAANEDPSAVVTDNSSNSSSLQNKSATYHTEHNSANGSICIPDI